jgi:hypothetical protein
MKRALLFLALSLGLKAQTLAGLPEVGGAADCTGA